MTKQLLSVLILTAGAAAAQKQELGLMLGGVLQQDRKIGTTSLSLAGGTSLHANYGVRLSGGRTAAVYGAINFIASPLREVTTANRLAIRDFATIYLTPEIRVKFAPSSAIAPFVFAGGGLAVYEHSTLNIAGAASGVARTSNTGTFTYGGGVDVRGWRWIGLRGEVRDSYSGSPLLNAGSGAGRQHNPTVAGGLVLRFGK
jgi:hypothetical protein